VVLGGGGVEVVGVVGLHEEQLIIRRGCRTICARRWRVVPWLTWYENLLLAVALGLLIGMSIVTLWL